MGTKRKSTSELRSPKPHQKLQKKKDDTKAPKNLATNIRFDEQTWEWTVTVTAAAPVLCQGQFTLSVLEGLVKTQCAHISPATGIVTLAGADCGQVLELEAVATQPLPIVRLPTNAAQVRLKALSEHSLVCTRESTAARALRPPQPLSSRWQQVLLSIDSSAAAGPAPTVLVCGAKKVGKSTFCRALVNTLLQTHATVALLETDLGQPELGPPGLLSLTFLQRPLTAPAHISSRRPDDSIFVGDVSPQSHPALYLSAVQKLHARYRVRAQENAGTESSAGSADAVSASRESVPLVINTSGWVKGLGLDLLVDMIAAISPSHVVAIQSDNERRNLPPGRFWEPTGAYPGAPVLEEIPGFGSQPDADAAVPSGPQASDASGDDAEATLVSAAFWGAPEEAGKGPAVQASAAPRAAVDTRALQMHAWVCSILHTDPLEAEARALRAPLAESAAALLARPPLVLDLADVVFVSLYDSCAPHEVPCVLNASFVGLLSVPRSSDAPLPSPADVQDLMRSDPPLCAGLALVHAVDMSAGRGGLVYVHTAASMTALEAVNTICLGRLKVFEFLLTAGPVCSPYMRIFSLSGDATGATLIKSRRNLLRASQQ